MSADQPTAELTTRDVLTQIDRRLVLIEGDGRELREQVDARFDGARRETSEEFARVRSEAAAFRKEVLDLFAAQRTATDAHWRWTVGLILVSWVSIMGTNLLR